MDRITQALQETFLFALAGVRAAIASVRDNSGLAALSIVLAFGLWIFVTDAENPTRSRVVDNVPVADVNTPSDLVLADPLPAVRVRVRVAEDVFESLTTADFEATVDLKGLSVGEYELPVAVRALTTRGNLRVEEVLPRRIQARLVPLVSKSVVAEVAVEGRPPAGYTLGSPEIEDSTALVTGSQENVALVVKAVAPVNVDGRTSSVRQSVRLTARDQKGGLVPSVSIEPSVMEVSIEIRQEEFSRAVAVNPRVSGSPADGYNVVAISVNPPAVTVQGSRAFIEGAATLPTRAVDIAGATEDVVRSVSLDVPSGATITGGVPVVTVTVKIEPAVGQVVLGVPVNGTNLDGALSIQGSLPFVQVTLFGPLPVLKSLTPSDVGATIDLSGKGAGTHKLQVKISAPAGVEVRSVSPSEIEITLEKR